MRLGLRGLEIHCRLPGVTGGSFSEAEISVFGLIKATLRSFDRRDVNGMY